MKFPKTTLLVLLLVEAVGAGAAKDKPGALRHRNLPKCVKKGGYCNPYPDDCCGSTVCEGVSDTCCIPEDERGCDLDADCCPLAADGVTPLECLDSLCVGSETDDIEDPRDCAIHGEPCNVTDVGDTTGTCCGDMKHLCDIVSVSEDDEDTRCCMEVGSKGCSYNYHCCDEVDGNYCDLESRCVFENGTYPGDSEGTLDCGLKDDPCIDVSECCGDTKYECPSTTLTCCLKSNINGCSADADCCDGHCDLALALCCIENGDACVHDKSYECCTGYCDSTTLKCSDL